MDANTKKVMFSSKSDDYGTPQEFYDACNKEFKFTLDVCANEKNAKCSQYFGWKRGLKGGWVLIDGLAKNWKSHKCWCNPPYSNIKGWIGKSYNASVDGALVALLVPSRTDTAWFHTWAYLADEIRFIRGRLKFEDMSAAAPFPSMLLIFYPKTVGTVFKSPRIVFWDWRK